jgi:flagellar capping protein FliD
MQEQRMLLLEHAVYHQQQLLRAQQNQLHQLQLLLQQHQWQSQQMYSRLQRQLQRAFSIFDTASTELREAVVGVAATTSVLTLSVAAQAEEAASASIPYMEGAERKASQEDAPNAAVAQNASEDAETVCARDQYTEEEISFLWRHGTRRELVDAGLISEWYPPPKENWFGEDGYDDFSDC